MALHYFVHNPLHDVESDIWMAIYFAIHRCSRRVFESTEWEVMQGYLLAVDDYTRTIFVHDISGSPRRQQLISDDLETDVLRTHLRHLHGNDTVFAQIFQAVASLRAAHVAVENSTLVTMDERIQARADPVNAPRIPISTFHEHSGVYETLRQIFRAISQRFVDGGEADPLIKPSSIDRDTGDIVLEPVEVTPPATVVDDAAPAGADSVQQGQAPKQLTGKRKNANEGQAGAGDEKHASKRSCQDAAGSAGSSGSESTGRKTRNARPPAQPTKQLKGLSKRKSDDVATTLCKARVFMTIDISGM